MFIKKNQRDFFYFLSKKYRYKSRAAFKLIELNRKFNFFSRTHCILDLCSAPGGWLQVARKFSPSSAYILGVDACDIVPIEGCRTLKGDITSFGCLFTIFNIQNFKKKKIDLVLHDGAPRMGISWNRDAFNQNDLALNAFKIAICCLKKKGWFVTKIFCSENIHGFLFALRFFFKKIFVCKPVASRQTSSETYLICKNFIIPDKIDRAILDKGYLFGSINLLKEISNSFKKNKLLSRKKTINILKIVRYKEKKKNLKNITIYFTDECLGSYGITFFGSILYAKEIRNKLNNKTVNTFFILLIFWSKGFF